MPQEAVMTATTRAIPSRSEQRPAHVLAGLPFAIATLALAIIGVLIAIVGGSVATWVIGAALAAIAALAVPGFFVLQPNASMVLILFGRYQGTEDRDGLWWTNPLTFIWRVQVSRRVRNFQTERLKVNDASGSPIVVAAVIVWRVVETARAIFDVQEFEQFVVVQSETAVRHLATLYPYDNADEGGPSLRTDTDDVSSALHGELQARLDAAGIEVLEARLTHLSYAQEIAEAMLRRQQATAIVAARRTIVDGAVGLVDMALERISDEGIVELDEERKAAMVSNLMVVLTGDRAPTPVINTGSLY
jgi:regulator of protease activity HflC (stomatin/prohibitin superfamily)